MLHLPIQSATGSSNVSVNNDASDSAVDENDDDDDETVGADGFAFAHDRLIVLDAGASIENRIPSICSRREGLVRPAGQRCGRPR